MFLPHYIERGILAHDPFVVLDQEGVGELIHIGVERGRRTRPNLKIGICGEHGGEPRSIAFCHRIDLDYVSCSPFRVPIARLAAAQAALQEQAEPVGTGRKGRRWPMTHDPAVDVQYMQQALELARGGLGFVSPNPLVGCVLVKDGAVVGRGYHQRFGGPHAEVHALQEAGPQARGAVLYVNLEPCSHIGQNPAVC